MSDTTGTGPLIRLILRRDRIRLPLWIIGITAVNAASAAAVKGTYNTSAEIAAYGPTAGDSAAGRITSGRQAALDTIGGIVANETTLIATVGVTLMVLFLVVRHTRAEEESGAFELVRSGVVGRHAQTLAVVAVAIAASVLIGLLHTVAFIGLGFDLTGSVAFGAEIAVLGVLFTGIAAAAAQVTESARGALGIGGAILGVTYVLRGVGAVGDNALYWLSPFGWAQTVDAFGDERWWLLGLRGRLELVLGEREHATKTLVGILDETDAASLPASPAQESRSPWPTRPSRCSRVRRRRTWSKCRRR